VKINSDINVLGSLPDWNLIKVFLSEDMHSIKEKGGIHTYTAIKTDKSVKRFEKAIKTTFLSFKNPKAESLFQSVIKEDAISNDVLLLLFWNASVNNELLNYLNTKVYFPAFYSGRISIKKDEIVACIKDLKESEDDLKKWSEITITTTASKYLTLLKKFSLMEGSVNKSIIHTPLSDTMFILFAYWLAAIAEKPNLLSNEWLQYSFKEKQVFIDRLLQKKFSKYFNVVYTGDRLSIEPIIPYESIYEHSTKS
jgi:phosphotransferase system HPr-like phosphotransfer protein